METDMVEEETVAGTDIDMSAAAAAAAAVVVESTSGYMLDFQTQYDRSSEGMSRKELLVSQPC